MITYQGHTAAQRYYYFENDQERHEFESYWNDKPASMQDGNGCRAMVIAISITLFFVAFLILLFSCAPKATAHRPRYNHWAQPYKMYAPVDQHNPHKK